MKVLLFGGTGMVGQGVLRECLLSADVSFVRTIGRTSVQAESTKHSDLVHEDLWHYQTIEGDLADFDACFFCLGTLSAGKSEGEYARVTFDLTLAAATTLARLNPNMIFIYMSGDGADSSERSRVMWARVRGRTENALLRLPFKGVYIFRPGLIQPMHGIKASNALYRYIYRAMAPVMPMLRQLLPSLVTSTEQVGKAMIAVAKHGAAHNILKTAEINRRSQDVV